MPTSAVAPRFIGHGKIELAPHTYRDPGQDEVLLRIEANAVCGSDRGQFFGGSNWIPGHEGVGVVVTVGDGVEIPIGTRGAIFLMDYCGQCRSCLGGHTNQCLAKRNDMGFTADGAYGPFEIVHETNLFPVPDEVTGVEATLLLDVMGTSGHAIGRICQMREDVESLYVSGAGPVGLGVLAMAKARFGTDFPVYISDFSKWRLDLAASLGGIPVDLTKGNPTGFEADVAVDTTGKSTARRSAIDLLSKRGVLACVGHGEGFDLTVSPDLIAPERTVMGSEYFRFSEMAGNLELLLANRELFGRIITHRVPRSEIARAFELFLGGETGKVVVVEDES